jgi:predicted nucleic acid-binding protein
MREQILRRYAGGTTVFLAEVQVESSQSDGNSQEICLLLTHGVAGRPNHHPASAGPGAVDDIRRWMRVSRVVVPEITELHLATEQSVRARYAALQLDLADAVNGALASEHDTDVVLTLDHRDFRAVRPLGRHESFRVLPDDLPL